MNTAAATRAVAAMRTVDTWLVARFRGVQLLPDSVVDVADATGAGSAGDAAVAAGNPVSDAAYARVESVFATPMADTLLALQFGAQTGRAPLTSGATVRLSGPTGAISATTARIVARRAFRVASRPVVSPSDNSAWRYGWAYVAVVPIGAKSGPGTGAGVRSGFRSWLLLEPGDSVRRR
jgi:hypothetical protein